MQYKVEGCVRACVRRQMQLTTGLAKIIIIIIADDQYHHCHWQVKADGVSEALGALSRAADEWRAVPQPAVHTCSTRVQ